MPQVNYKFHVNKHGFVEFKIYMTNVFNKKGCEFNGGLKKKYRTESIIS